MTVWDIKVLYYGKIKGPKSLLTPGFDDHLELWFPYLGFLLQNGHRNILVDTGIADDFIVDGKAWAGLPAEGGRAFVERSLAEAGVTPSDIDTVIFTHLHNDHASNTDIFKDTNTTFIFQRDEWKCLLDPLPAMRVRGDYKLELIEELRNMKCLMIDGDMDFTDGIRLFKTPGHTLGHQSLAVRTEEGMKVVVGDHFSLYCMAYADQEELIDMDGNKHKITPAPEVYAGVIPSTLIYNFYDFYESCDRIKAHMEYNNPDFMVPGHELSLLVTGA